MVGLDLKPATSQITHDNSRPGQLGGGSYRVRMVWEMLPERLHVHSIYHTWTKGSRACSWGDLTCGVLLVDLGFSWFPHHVSTFPYIRCLKQTNLFNFRFCSKNAGADGREDTRTTESQKVGGEGSVWLSDINRVFPHFHRIEAIYIYTIYTWKIYICVKYIYIYMNTGIYEWFSAYNNNIIQY